MSQSVSIGDTKISTSNSAEEAVLEISGIIDEKTDFGKVQIPAKPVLVLELGGVVRLNSMGLRHWLEWSKALGQKFKIRFRNCSPVVVEQMSILRGFVPMGGIVESVQVPYVCSSCEFEETTLAQRGRDYLEETADRKEGLSVPSQKECPNCNESMDIDVLPNKYFAFLKRRP